jgi:predicted dehydrogenase
LLDLAVHHVDLLRFLLADDVTSVSATIRSRATEDDTAHMTVEMTGGVSAEVSALLGEKFCDSVRICGDDGQLWVDRVSSLSVGFARSGSPDTPRARIMGRFPTPRRLAYLVAKLRSPFSEPSFAPALDAFVRCALSGTNPSPDLDDGFAALAVADAAERSALAGKPVLAGAGGGAVAGLAPAGLS